MDILENMRKMLEAGKISKEDIERAFPVLKESEDERIRSEIVDFINRNAERGDDIEKSVEWIAYLENQKEQKALRCTEGFYTEGGTEFEIVDVEQKPVAHEIGFVSKPVDLQVKGDGVYKICPHCKERMIRDDSKVYTSMPPQYGYNCPKCGAFEFDTVMYDSPAKEEQKPVEWSEEDYKNLARIENLLIAIAEKKRLLPITDAIARELLEWLKPLRPFKQEWSEEDEDMLKSIIATCQLAAQDRDSGPARHLLEIQERFLKSLRPRPHWKPSEEQMAALLAAEGYIRGNDGIDLAKKLMILYEQLEKL